MKVVISNILFSSINQTKINIIKKIIFQVSLNSKISFSYFKNNIYNKMMISMIKQVIKKNL